MLVVGSIIRTLERWIPPVMMRDAYVRRRALLTVGISAFLCAAGLVMAGPIVLVLGAKVGWLAGLNTLIVAAFSGAGIVLVKRTESLVLARVFGNWVERRWTRWRTASG